MTDSETEIRFDPATKPGVSNLLEILATATDRSVDDVAGGLQGQGYGALKTATADAVVALVRPVQERFAALEGDPGAVDAALALGAGKAEAMASKVVERVRRATGLLPRT